MFYLTETERIRKAKTEYARKYRKEHPDRVKAAQDRYWLKKTQVNKEDAESNGQQPQ